MAKWLMPSSLPIRQIPRQKLFRLLAFNLALVLIVISIFRFFPRHPVTPQEKLPEPALQALEFYEKYFSSELSVPGVSQAKASPLALGKCWKAPLENTSKVKSPDTFEVSQENSQPFNHSTIQPFVLTFKPNSWWLEHEAIFPVVLDLSTGNFQFEGETVEGVTIK